MKVSSSFHAMPLNRILYANRLGRNAGQNGQGVAGAGSLLRKDRSSFSPYGTSSSIVDILNKQKTSIEDRKNELIASAEEKGLSQESIQAQLDSYDEQLKKIDEQITEASVQQMITATEQQGTVEKNNTQPKTEQEIQNEKINNLLSLSNSFDRVSITTSVKTKIDGSSRVLESEIEQDKSRASASDYANSIAEKEEELAAMQQQSRSLTAEIGRQVADLNEQIQENNKPTDPIEESKPDEEQDRNHTAAGESVSDTTVTEETGNTGGSGAYQTWINRYVQMAQMYEMQPVEAPRVNALV